MKTLSTSCGGLGVGILVARSIGRPAWGVKGITVGLLAGRSRFAAALARRRTAAFDGLHAHYRRDRVVVPRVLSRGRADPVTKRVVRLQMFPSRVWQLVARVRQTSRGVGVLPGGVERVLGRRVVVVEDRLVLLVVQPLLVSIKEPCGQDRGVAIRRLGPRWNRVVGRRLPSGAARAVKSVCSMQSYRHIGKPT